MTQHCLISQFEQVNVMNGRANAAATAGACHNFAIHWCGLMLQDSDPAHADTRMATLAANRGGASPVLQKVFTDAFSEQNRDWKTADDLCVAIRGLVRKDYVIPYGGYDQTQLKDTLLSPDWSAMVYSFDFPGGILGAANGCHSIAFFRPLHASKGKVSPVSDKISAYDPNFGEYLIDKIELNYWINKLKQTYAGNILYHRMFYLKENK
ncbi:hypothetical protein [Chitinivorax sp. B]|uniref:hypothetical protein n=1 Tax=Chitinivorax sp. B TaxID=2502235 RepID=UPI0010F6CABC|nr:hypothetical protein [Chitinivorax sp. B]